MRLSISLLLAAATTAIARNTTQVYDYAIAGAGTAGLLLAIVLTEDPAINVAVLEAGSDGRTNPNITIPELRGEIIDTEYDWAYYSIVQPGLYENRSQAVNRGKTIGGTSAMNWMIHNEDSRIQLDIWESLLNLTSWNSDASLGWNWETLSTAFRESEVFFAPSSNASSAEQPDPTNHGSSGYICSTLQRSVLSLLSDYVTPALLNAGYAVPGDRNGGNVTGAGLLPLAICPGNYTRSYSGSAYTAVQDRRNLHLYTNAQVTDISWISTTTGNVTARGLNYVDTSGRTSNTSLSIQAQDIILSAGIAGSAPILERSGIGNPDILTPLNITPIVNLSSVGTGLRDPLMMQYQPLQYNFSVEFTGGEYAQNYIDLRPAQDVLSPADYNAASVWLNETTSIPGLEDAQLLVFKHLWFTRQPLIEMAWQYSSTQSMPYTLIPLSQGTVHINTSDPLAAPVIDPNYNSVTAIINNETVPWDLWLLSRASQFYVTQLASTPPFSDVLTKTDPDHNLSPADYQQAVYERTGTSQHLTGGLPMLPRSAGGAIASDLLVYGTRNVRVVDGSIFPYQPSAHPMGLTYAVAVHAAKILQQARGTKLTYTELPGVSNSSSNATAVFPTNLPTATYDVRGSAVPASSSVVASTGGVEKVEVSGWVLSFCVMVFGRNALM
ncbi:alcohol oxidase [Aureobasidium pullulans]|uniref:Alcohol oxidase n=1 Tax=Aureobasidium pullulans TaxID=5580 RepID=A0A4V4LJR7_AURPU|nr:alcohol oxidase [Aureobasidium pullulans]TIA56347.1 alcohol oxidase [Aureobasidium pullulans]